MGKRHVGQSRSLKIPFQKSVEEGAHNIPHIDSHLGKHYILERIVNTELFYNTVIWVSYIDFFVSFIHYNSLSSC